MTVIYMLELGIGVRGFWKLSKVFAEQNLWVWVSIWGPFLLHFIIITAWYEKVHIFKVNSTFLKTQQRCVSPCTACGLSEQYWVEVLQMSQKSEMFFDVIRVKFLPKSGNPTYKFHTQYLYIKMKTLFVSSCGFPMQMIKT